MRAHRAEIDAIAASPEPPTFDNTIAALDRSGRLLARIDELFHNLTASETSPALQAVEREMAPPLAAHAQRDLHARGAVRAHRRAARAARRAAASTPSSCACSSACTSTSCAPARAWPDRSAGALRADHGAARRADDALRAERAGRRDRLPARAARRGRPRRPARLRARRRAPGGDASAAIDGCARDHAVALAHRAVPHLLATGATCASRPGAPGPRAASTTGGTTTGRSRARSCALRNEQARAARLRQLCRLRARRHDGARAAR